MRKPQSIDPPIDISQRSLSRTSLRAALPSTGSGQVFAAKQSQHIVVEIASSA
jgi:hypothetical protein